MAKVVKIKQSDIENIVENIIFEQFDEENTDDLDSSKGGGYMDEPNDDDDERHVDQLNYTVAKSEDGHYAVINPKTGEILGIK